MSVRRTLCLFGSVFAVAASVTDAGGEIALVTRTESVGKNAHYAFNREPLLPSPMASLPLGALRAEGWLRHQLELMADGQTGHLEEISPFLTPDSGWLGGTERGWEEAAYWFRGFYDLARLTEDERLLEIAQRWMERIIASQLPDGYYGSAYNHLVQGKDGKRIVDVWPQMVMNDVLISQYEATGDARILPMMLKFFAFCRDLPDEQFLPAITWDYYENYSEYFGDWKPRIQLKRAGDFVPQILWLYNQTGEAWLLELAIKVYHRTQPPMNEWLDNHGVHFSQRFRYPAQMYPLTGDSRYLEATRFFYDTFMQCWGQMPRGIHATDERIRAGKVDARQAIETCSMSELNKSHYILGRITGDTLYADRVEDMTFNHLPVSHAPDYRGLRYLTACNMPYSVPGMDFLNQGTHPVYAADLHRCCQHNSAMGWPSFVRNLWQATPDNGLIAWLYAPNTVTAKVGEEGALVTIASDTRYPFDGALVMTVRTEQPVAFPLYLRVPGWCREVGVKIPDAEEHIVDQAGKLVKINRTWKRGDRVEVNFGMEVKATTWPRTGAITIDRGPLSYSIRIKERWQVEPGGPEGWPRHSVWPDSSWNYGLVVDPERPAASIQVEVADSVAAQPWTEAAAPIVLRVPAKRIPGWEASIKNTVDAVREGPVRSNRPTELIEMIPMGCARLRMSVLPVISDRADARTWVSIPNPDEFMLERLTR